MAKQNYKIIFAALFVVAALTALSCDRAAEAERPAEKFAQSRLDLSQKGRRPIEMKGYYAAGIRNILQKDSIVVGMIESDRPPFFYTTADGSMEGLDVEIALGIANLFGVRLVIDRSARTKFDIFENVARGKYDFAVSKFSMTPERSMAISFSVPYVTLRHAFLVNKMLAARHGAVDYPYDYLRKPGAVIGVSDGSAYEVYARKNFPEAEIRTYKDADSLIDAAIDGKIFAALYDNITFVQKLMKNHEISLYTYIYTVDDLHDYICAGVPRGSGDLLEVINAFLMVNRYDYVLDDLIRDYPESFD